MQSLKFPIKDSQSKHLCLPNVFHKASLETVKNFIPRSLMKQPWLVLKSVQQEDSLMNNLMVEFRTPGHECFHDNSHPHFSRVVYFFSLLAIKLLQLWLSRGLPKSQNTHSKTFKSIQFFFINIIPQCLREQICILLMLSRLSLKELVYIK